MARTADVSFDSWNGVSDAPVVMAQSWKMKDWMKKQIEDLNMNRKSKRS